jgi:hypothetical protein
VLGSGWRIAVEKIVVSGIVKSGRITISSIGIESSKTMTPEEYRRLYNLIQDPPPGSKMEAAKKIGVDLKLILYNLTLTPTERVERMEAAAKSARPGQAPFKTKNLYVLYELEALKELHEILKSIPAD